MKLKMLLVLLLILTMTFSVYSKDVGKKLALGCGMYSVNSLNGSFTPPAIGVRYWILSKIGAQLNFGYASVSAPSGAVDPENETESQFFIGLQGLYLLSQGDKVNLNANLSLGFNMWNNIDNMADTARTDTILKIGFSPEIFIYDNFALEVYLGLTAIMYGETTFEGEGYDDDYSVTTFGGTPILSMLGLGFHYYF